MSKGKGRSFAFTTDSLRRFTAKFRDHASCTTLRTLFDLADDVSRSSFLGHEPCANLFPPIISSYFHVSEGRNVLAAFKWQPACEILSLFTPAVRLSLKLPGKTRSCDSVIGQILPSLDAKTHKVCNHVKYM